VIAKQLAIIVVAIALASALPTTAQAGYAHCPDARQIGTTANAKPGSANDIVAVSAFSAESPKGGAYFVSFAYVYTSRAAGLYLQDTSNRGIVPLTGTSLLDVRRAYARYKATPGRSISNGATMVLDHGWTLLPPLQCHP
jgi:hypothetical protein